MPSSYSSTWHNRSSPAFNNTHSITRIHSLIHSHQTNISYHHCHNHHREHVAHKLTQTHVVVIKKEISSFPKIYLIIIAHKLQLLLRCLEVITIRYYVWHSYVYKTIPYVEIKKCRYSTQKSDTIFWRNSYN